MKALFGRILLSCVKAVPLARIQNQKGEWSDYTISDCIRDAAVAHLSTHAKLTELHASTTAAKELAGSAMSKADRQVNNLHTKLAHHEDKIKELYGAATNGARLHATHMSEISQASKRIADLEQKPVTTKKATVRAAKSAKRVRK